MTAPPGDAHERERARRGAGLMIVTGASSSVGLLGLGLSGVTRPGVDLSRAVGLPLAVMALGFLAAGLRRRRALAGGRLDGPAWALVAAVVLAVTSRLVLHVTGGNGGPLLVVSVVSLVVLVGAVVALLLSDGRREAETST